MKSRVSSLSGAIAAATGNAAALAALLAATAAVAFAAPFDGYSHLHHPLALLGAAPLPHATAFNLAMFVVPGLLVAWTALRLRAALAVASTPAGAASTRWLPAIGAQLMLISALAFAAQGLLPLDASDLDGPRSGRHASAWMVWWIASAAGGVLLATGLRKDWPVLAATSLLAAALLPVFALALPQLIPAGVAQRLAFALWFAWAIHAGHHARRHAVARQVHP